MSNDFKRVEWKVNVKMWAMKQPLTILHSKLLKIATIANNIECEEIMKICCELSLYKECDPYNDEYDIKKMGLLLKEKV